MNKRMITLCAAIALLFFAFSGCGLSARAEENKVEYNTIYYLEKSEVVSLIQQTLQRLGYFNDGDIISFGTLDETTVRALERFYEANHFGWEGSISPDVQRYLLEGSPAPRPTPEPVTPSPTPDDQPTPFPIIYPNAPDNNMEVVVAVQNALASKGYYEGLQGNMNLGYYDSVTEEAVKRFCETIHIAYKAEEGITLPLYNFIVVNTTNLPQYSAPSPTPFNLISYGSSGEEVHNIQNRLNQLGYFRDLKEPQWGIYDETTSNAVRRFCNVHGLPINQNGMDSAFYERLMSDKALENPVERHDIYLGERNNELLEIQERLFNLGYYKAGQFRTGVYDPDMNTALENFAEINHIEYDGRTLTVLLQEAIFAEKAIPFSESAIKGNSKPLAGEVNFLGIRMPLFVMILLMVIILAALAFLVIRVFFSQDKNGENNQNPGNSYSSGNQSYNSNARQLSLEIRFQGSTRQINVSMDKPLRIGRTEKTLPLDYDSDISRQHCQLSFRGDTLILRDYSTNGTEVNHQMYHNCECVIHNGDTFKIGKHEITVRF